MTEWMQAANLLLNLLLLPLLKLLWDLKVCMSIMSTQLKDYGQRIDRLERNYDSVQMSKAAGFIHPFIGSDHG